MDDQSRKIAGVNRLKPQRPAISDLGRLCLDHLALDPELLGQFMIESGHDWASLRRAIGTPGLDAGLIDYFARNEPMLLALCEANTIRPEAFMAVWQKLNSSQ